MNQQFLQQAETYLRLYLHTTVPMHGSMVEAMCRSANPPLELATVLEDIGHCYIKMAADLNGEIIRSGRIDDEPENPDDFAEARIATFTAELMASAGIVVFSDGMRLDGRAALEALPAVGDAIKGAVVLARGKRGRMGPRSIG